MHASPWIYNAARPDPFSLKRLVAHESFKGLKDEALAVAIWRYTVDPVTGFYHFWSPADREFGPVSHGLGTVSDPLKLLNSHGAMLCGTVAAFFVAACEAAGLPARMVGVTGHTISEAYYDGAWHLLDCDLRAFHRKRDGSRAIASLRELLQDPTLVSDPVEPSAPVYYLPDRSPAGTAEHCYKPGYGDEMPRSIHWFHTMDYLLRPGETLTRYAREDGGRWHFPPHWVRDSKKYEKEWTQRGQRERFAPHRTYFNGCFEYKPDLTSASRDLSLGAWTLSNIGAGETGMTALDPRRPGRAVFLIHSPWIVTGAPQDLADPDKKTGAVLVDLEIALAANRGGRGAAALRFSGDGKTWTEVARVTSAGRLHADLTDEFDRRYRGLLAIDLEGAAVATSLETQVWFQHTVNTYPYLTPGESVFRYHGLDDHGRRTLTEVWRADLETSADSFVEHIVSSANLTRGPEPLNRLSPADPNRPWQAVFQISPRVLSPRGIVRAWCYASIASVKGDPDAPPPEYFDRRPRAKLEAALHPDGPWTLLREADVPVHKQGYHFSLDGTFSASGTDETEGVPHIYMRVTSDMPGWEIRAAVSCAMPVPPSGVPRLEIVHQWDEDGQPREHRHAVRDSSSAFEYRVLTGGGKVTDTAVALRVPSTRKA
ncbi:MAG: hypothetical protein KIS92_10060 [Planctomycetota bacterium]|nr:hypothetical protein [Planctomycetota bacterium]